MRAICVDTTEESGKEESQEQHEPSVERKGGSRTSLEAACPPHRYPDS